MRVFMKTKKLPQVLEKQLVVKKFNPNFSCVIRKFATSHVPCHPISNKKVSSPLNRPNILSQVVLQVNN